MGDRGPGRRASGFATLFFRLEICRDAALAARGRVCSSLQERGVGRHLGVVVVLSSHVFCISGVCIVYAPLKCVPDRHYRASLPIYLAFLRGTLSELIVSAIHNCFAVV